MDLNEFQTKFERVAVLNEGKRCYLGYPHP